MESIFSICVNFLMCLFYNLCYLSVSVNWFFSLYTIFSVFSSLEILDQMLDIACWVFLFFAVPSMFWGSVLEHRWLIEKHFDSFRCCFSALLGGARRSFSLGQWFSTGDDFALLRMFGNVWKHFCLAYLGGRD